MDITKIHKFIFSFGADIGFMLLYDLLSINSLSCEAALPHYLIEVTILLENQGLCGRHLLPFSPLTCPQDFFLHLKKPATAMQATIQLKYISVFINQFLTLFS